MEVFLIPYVIPIPKESILTDKASKIIVISIIPPLYIICMPKTKVKNSNKKSKFAYKLIKTQRRDLYVVYKKY